MAEHNDELRRSLSDLSSFIAEERGSDIIHSQLVHDELTIAVEAGALLDFVRFLRDDPQCGFVNIIDVCGVF